MEEETSLLEVRQILATIFSVFAKENTTSAEVEQHEITEIDKLRIKLPRPNFGADKIADLMKKCDHNSELCLQFIGGWIMPNAGKASKSGISFKLIPWVHQWYYFPDEPTPLVPKTKRAKHISEEHTTKDVGVVSAEENVV